MKQLFRNASIGVAMTFVLGMFTVLTMGCGAIDTTGFLGLETCDILNCDGIFFANLADDHIDDMDDHDDDGDDDDHMDDADDHDDDGDDDHMDDMDVHNDDDEAEAEEHDEATEDDDGSGSGVARS